MQMHGYIILLCKCVNDDYSWSYHFQRISNHLKNEQNSESINHNVLEVLLI
jgi:hypothetical protein